MCSNEWWEWWEEARWEEVARVVEGEAGGRAGSGPGAVPGQGSVLPEHKSSAKSLGSDGRWRRRVRADSAQQELGL